MIRRELTLFLIVGALTVLVDFLTYRGLLWSAAVGIDTAKGGGFLVGTLFAYFANRFCTFAHAIHPPGSPWRFGLLYTITLSANVAVNAIVLQLLIGSRSATHLAFLSATAISASLNFLGMKRFVFRAGSIEVSR